MDITFRHAARSESLPALHPHLSMGKHRAGTLPSGGTRTLSATADAFPDSEMSGEDLPEGNYEASSVVGEESILATSQHFAGRKMKRKAHSHSTPSLQSTFGLRAGERKIRCDLRDHLDTNLQHFDDILEHALTRSKAARRSINKHLEITSNWERMEMHRDLRELPTTGPKLFDNVISLREEKSSLEEKIGSLKRNALLQKATMRKLRKKLSESEERERQMRVSLARSKGKLWRLTATSAVVVKESVSAARDAANQATNRLRKELVADHESKMSEVMQKLQHMSSDDQVHETVRQAVAEVSASAEASLEKQRLAVEETVEKMRMELSMANADKQRILTENESLKRCIEALKSKNMELTFQVVEARNGVVLDVPQHRYQPGLPF